MTKVQRLGNIVTAIVMIIFAILLFGAYGTGYQPVDLIYAGF